MKLITTEFLIKTKDSGIFFQLSYYESINECINLIIGNLCQTTCLCIFSQNIYESKVAIICIIFNEVMNSIKNYNSTGFLSLFQALDIANV